MNVMFKAVAILNKIVSYGSNNYYYRNIREFKLELLEEIKAIINHQTGFAPKKWLKSPEVRDLLSISPGTLQNFRINGTLPYTKVGGVIYYDYEEIQKVMQENRIHNKF